MGRIPRETVDAIRDRTDIASVIGRRVKLQRRGRDYVGLCPFHQEKSPSFNVIPHKGMYHCFGCQEGGDVFRFVMKVEGLSFVEAVKELAAAAGVPIEEEELTVEQRHRLRTRATLFDVLEEAASFYESMLWTHPDGQDARDYLATRDLPVEISREARIGFAPDGWQNLGDRLHASGFPVERAIEAGLVKRSQSSGRTFDFFRNRLMFPIRDDRGRVIGFGGRVLNKDDPKAPKYLNTGETPLYDKRQVLYGIESARAAIQRADRTIVVEGYFDVLAMRAAGHPEAVATCGTALTPEHVSRLSRMSRNLLLLTDGDNAGQEAAVRALPLLIDASINAFRVDLPDAKDPDEYRKAYGAEALSEALESHRRGLVEWVIDRRLAAAGDGREMTAMSRSLVLEELRPVLSRLPSALIPRLAPRLGMRDEEVLARLQGADPADERPTTPAATGWRPVRDMVHVFWLLVHRYDEVADILQGVPTDVFADHPATHGALSRLLTGEPIAAVVAEEPDPGVARTLAAVVARESLYTAEQAPLAMAQVVRRLLAPRQLAEKAQLSARIEEALRDGDRAAQAALLRRNQELKHEVAALEAALRQGDLVAFLGCVRNA
jgi:DNA primase